MGTRFLLTQESTVPDEVKQFYLARSVHDTVRTTKVDGVPHRVLQTELVKALEHEDPVRGLVRAIRNAVRFARLTGTSPLTMLREGMAMKKRLEMTWSQVIVAANTPMLLKAAMVEGRTDLGVMSSGQVVGVLADLPTVAELIDRIVAEASEVLMRLGPLALESSGWEADLDEMRHDVPPESA
jgi:NAD(P)H-dependent flavin oxidoreductase YrpB (nitropropane dioxygenase family)